MTKAEAKRYVCDGAWKILDNDSDNEWLSEGLSEADAHRMREAFDELCAELRRRGSTPSRAPSYRGSKRGTC